MKRLINTYPVLLTLAWGLVILVLCATPGQYIPSASWLELLSVDKLVHASVFFILTSLLLVVAIKHHQGAPYVILYVTLSILYGMFLELMQAMVFSNRSADWMDVIANSFGCVMAVILFRRIRKWILMPLI